MGARKDAGNKDTLQNDVQRICHGVCHSRCPTESIVQSAFRLLSGETPIHPVSCGSVRFGSAAACLESFQLTLAVFRHWKEIWLQK